MPRANRRRRDEPADVSRLGGGTATARYAGHLWTVRSVTGATATRAYLCPGCQQGIEPGVPHVVVWPAEGVGRAGRPEALAYRLLAAPRRPPGRQRLPMTATVLGSLPG